jgi:monoamine oxidase
MPVLSRRTFLGGAAAFAATPTGAAIPKSGSVDVVVVGAGAAGIAATRRLVAAGRKVALIEASDQVGGRCITDNKSLGVPFDRGAHWINVPDSNPIVKLAGDRFKIDQMPRGQRLRIGRRPSREGEREDFLVTQVRSQRAIVEAARGKSDLSCAQALPHDLGEWRATIDFTLGPYSCGKDLADVSAVDVAHADEHGGVDAVCRQGYGALLAHCAADLPVALATQVRRIDWARGVDVETSRGQFSARAAIVTVSTNVLASDAIKFHPDLPKPQLDAAAKLSLGSYDHVALELAGNPLELLSDDLVFEKAKGRETAALLGNVSGTNVCVVTVGGRFGRDLAAQGEAAMTAFAIDWLAGLYGADVKKAVKRRVATNWNRMPFVRGAFSAAAPGGQPGRRLLMQPLHDRIWFAGEAVHETLWGTVGGAWESGERAAAAVLARLAEPAARPSREKPAPRAEPAERRERRVRKRKPAPAPAAEPESGFWPFGR